MNARRHDIALALAAALLLAGCRGGPAPADLGALAQEATVTRGTIADVVQVAGQVVALNSRTLTFSSVGGRVLEVNVRAGQHVEKGQPLVRIDTAGQERTLREAEADLKVAEATLAEAERVAATAELAQAEANLAKAEAELARARIRLAAAQAAGLAPLQEAVAEAEADLQLAKDQLRQQELTANQATIRELDYNRAYFQRAARDASTPEERAKAEETMATLERELAGARAARDDALSAAGDEVAEKEEALAQARAALARAEAGEEDPSAEARLAHEQASTEVQKARNALEELKLGQDSAAVQAARTTYEAALARVETAEDAIASSTMTAPFGGMVWMVYVAPGDWVGPGNDVIYLADPEELRVQAQATEMDVTRLSVGQKVRLTFDAFPGQVYAGEVLSMPLRGKESGGLSVYEIETSLEQEGSEIRSGMLANVRFVVGEKPDVLIIPAAAVQYRGNNETYVALRGPDGKTQEQTVEIGINDGIMAEVLSGLNEGQTVLVPLVAPMDPRNYGPGGVMMGAVPAQRVVVQ